MTFAVKSLADGQLATTWATLYGPGVGVKAILRSADFFNTNAVAQTLELRVTRSGSTARKFPRATLLQNESLRLLTDGEVIVLSASDVLQAQTTTATAVDFTITGAEE